MLNPDGKIQGVFVATGVKTLTTEVLVGSDVEVGRSVIAGSGVGVCVAVAAMPVKAGIAGPQEARKI
jgi:chemotaxis receptor (MCP) glutamine deamidase CheD